MLSARLFWCCRVFRLDVGCVTTHWHWSAKTQRYQGRCELMFFSGATTVTCPIKQDRSRDMYPPIWQNTRNNYTQALLTESLRWVSEDRLKIPSFVIFYINYLLFIYEWLFTWMFICCCCNLMMFYDWSECTMSVLGTTKHSSCNCIDTWQ